MGNRLFEPALLEALDEAPAVVLLGARQAGKTTLALSLVDALAPDAAYLDLELPSDRERLMLDPEYYFNTNEGKLIVLDEIHRAPEIFQTLRGVIDKRRRKGRRTKQFLLLGSASLDLMNQSSESLAGRIAYLELTPVLIAELAEFGTRDLNPLWLRGGFPDSLMARTDSRSLRWRENFIRSYLERDIPMFGSRIPATTMERFWQMLAHNQGQMLNAAHIAGSLAVSGQSVARYLDLLVDLLLVRRLPPWEANAGKRLVRTPKVYIRDSGIVHALLNIETLDGLLGHPVCGATWETMIIENFLAIAPTGTKAHFYRTSAGAEIDLVLTLSAKERWAIEVKRSVSKPVPSKGFYFACDDINPKRRMLIYAGDQRFQLDKKTEVLPASAVVPALFD